MGFLDSIERLINEHGSSAILRERIALANEKFAALEFELAAVKSELAAVKAENAGLKSENAVLRAENQALKLDKIKLQEQVEKLENRFYHNSNPRGYVCDHCGSQNLKRTGNRPHPTFGALGEKETLFVCESCGKQSAFLSPL